jgi:broad specificity phosphatase PhoE
VTRLLLVRHAPTAATRAGAFAVDEPIDAGAGPAAAALAPALPQTGVILSSPALRCRQTAAALGLRPKLEPDLAECDFGSWQGRTFAEITADEPPHLIDGWLHDPDVAPHGGESLTGFSARVAGWLTGVAGPSAEPVVAFTHAGVVRAAVVRALAAPVEAFWRIAAEPLSITELRFHEGAWTLMRSNWTALG